MITFFVLHTQVNPVLLQVAQPAKDKIKIGPTNLDVPRHLSERPRS